MKLGINILLWTAAATEEHLNLLGDINDWGYDGIEFPAFAADCSPWQTLAAKLDSLGLERTALTTVSVEANPIAESRPIRQAAVDHVKACVDSCISLGSKLLVGPLLSLVGRLVGRGRTDQEWNWGIQSLREAAEYAATAGVTLVVEPLNRFETYFLNSCDDVAQFMDEVGHPHLRMMIDTFHANIEEKDPIGATKSAADRLVHSHISENDRSTPGEGHIRWPQVFSALEEIGYDNWQTVEAFGRTLPEVAAATCIWRDMIPGEEHLARSASRFIRESWWPCNREHRA